MSKVFRLHTSGGKNDSTDWFECQPYDSKIINDIKDPDGADARKQITSIPSPFARVDLVKTAFAEVVNSGNLDGDTIYHRMVSETLDVAEIFFNFNMPKIKDNFKIVSWNRQLGMESLLSQHKDVAETLEMFLKQDADAYNFGLWQNIYLLQYTGPDSKEMQIVGLTSPCTMFCSTANNHSAITKNIQFGQDCPFDMDFQPLYKRDENFIKYLYTFRANCDRFSSIFKELDDYMSFTFDNKLSNEMRTIIRDLRGGANAFDAYKELKFDAAQTVEILGYLFHTKGVQTVLNSDFELKSSITYGDNPLVLPCEIGNTYAHWRYTQDEWGCNHKAPYYDPIPINERTLPFDNNRHPYLTISDLLEDTILEIPDSKLERLPNGTTIGGFNRQWFFDGNRLDGDNKVSADAVVTLLPVKPLFFEYFTTDELINGIDGKQLISIYTNAAGYRVVLRIPTRKGFVEFERLYMNTRDVTNNKGCRTELDNSFAFALLPPVKARSDEESYYRIALSTDFAHCKTTRMKLFNNGKELSTEPIVRNDRAEHVHVSQIIALDHQRFDFIQISDSTHGDACGILLPRFRGQQSAGSTYRFAIDFGTTNTHIEYRIGKEKPRPFSISSDNSPMQYLCNYTNKRYVLEADMLPSTIGNDSTFSYPTRTALAEPLNLNWQQPVKTMAHVNPAFTYEKRQTYAYTKVTTNLKWENADSQRAKEYIRSLMLLIRSKVLVEGGSLENTRIAWFYPTAMTQFKQGKLEKEWIDAYRDYFGDNIKNLQPITESEAPYIAYKNANNVTDNVVTVDIGGGTTDIVVVSNGKLQAISSFRFAADAIFGSGFTDGQGSPNGIVNHFQKQIADVLENNGMNDLLDILNRLGEQGRSEDIASFLFSLHDNKTVQEKGISDKVDFNAILRDDQDFKLSILLFYVAIIYHISRIMCVKGLPAPRIISFSGNGSKVLQSIGSERTLNTLTRHIVELSFGSTGINGIEVNTTPHPKEQTCRGGLQDDQPMEHDEAISKIVILKNRDALYGKDETYATAIEEKEKKLVVASVNEYLDFVKRLNQSFSFADQFGVSKNSIQHLDGVCRRDLDEYLSKGIYRKLNEMNEDTNEKVQETMFFYPLIGVISALNTEIYNSLYGNTVTEPTIYTYLTNIGGGNMKESPSTTAQFKLMNNGENGTGEFEFCGDTNAALANLDATFDGAATYSGNGSCINTVERGFAKSIGEGYWQVTKLATIKIR